MNYTFTLTNTPQGQLFESKRQLSMYTHKAKVGHLKIQGILHTIQSNQPFVLCNYLSTHLTSKKIDDRKFMVQFPSGAPITPEMEVSLFPLDQVLGVSFDVHYEMGILDLDIPPNMCVQVHTQIMRVQYQFNVQKHVDDYFRKIK